MSNSPESVSTGRGSAPLRIIFFIVMMDLFGFGIIIPLLPDYVHEMLAHPLKVTLLFSIYSMCQFIGAPILGVVSDRFGRRPVLVMSQAGSAVGYLLLMSASMTVRWTLALVYLSRIIDGFTGGNISTAQAYISDITSPNQRARAMGVLGAAFGVGFTLGPAAGGILGKFNLMYPAILAAVMSGGAAIASYLALPESRSKKPAEAEVWLHPRKLLPIFRAPVLRQLLLISFLLMSAFVMMESTIVLFISEPVTFNWDKLHTALYFVFVGLVIVVVQGGLVGRLTARYGEWKLSSTGPVLVALGMAGLVFVAYMAGRIPHWQLLAALLVAGAVNAIGRSIQQPTMSSLISKFSQAGDQGIVFGAYHGLGSLARFAGPVVAGAVFIFMRHSGQFVLAGAMALVVALWTVLLYQRAGEPPDPEQLAVAPNAGEAHAELTEPA